MRRYIWLLILPLLGCPSKPPEPTPPPPVVDTGRPSSPVGLELLLRVAGQKFVRADGPYSMTGAIPCWPTDGTGDKLFVDGVLTDYWWPLVSPDWISKTSAKGFNMYHVRPGPFDASEICCGLEDVGGPYAEDGSWNQKFWDRFHVGLRAAVEAKANVEVDVIDGWIIKHAQYGDVHMPWSPVDVQRAMNVPLIPTLKAWVKKVVWESTNYGNVIYQISNESQLAVNWTPEWEQAVYAEIRANEENVVHLIGSNTKDYSGPFDYYSSHDAREGGAPIAGRPMSVNEYNPHLTAATFQAKYCDARAAGQAFWYWRSDGSDAVQDASLNSVKCDAPPVTSCPPPLPDRGQLTIRLNCGDNGICDSTPVVEGVHEYCASIGMGTFNGQPRYGCPMRNECPDTPGYEGMCEDRLACEQYALQASAPVFTTDGRIDYMGVPPELAFRVRCYECSWIQVCDGTGKICAKKVF